MKWPTPLRPHSKPPSFPSNHTLQYLLYNLALHHCYILTPSSLHHTSHIPHTPRYTPCVFLHYYGLHYSCQFTVSTFHRKAVVPYSAFMSCLLGMQRIQHTVLRRSSIRADLFKSQRLLRSTSSSLPILPSSPAPVSSRSPTLLGGRRIH
jgi:hypothetical protein